MRENEGEIEAALKGELPELVALSYIRGDLHVHTNWSEGKNTIEEMAERGKALGYEYMLISDHAGLTIRVANPMDEKRLAKQGKEIDRINKSGETNGFPFLLKVAEINIKKDSGVDIADKSLKELDIVIASIHNAMRQPKEKIMKRLFSAMENEHVDVIAHPTGRLINKREPYELIWAHFFWKFKSRNRGGRPKLTPDTISLIQTMAKENTLWGAERIHGELLKLNITVATTTIKKYLRQIRSNHSSSQTWSVFQEPCSKRLGV